MVDHRGDRRTSETRMLERRMSNNRDDLSEDKTMKYFLSWFNQWSCVQKTDFVKILSHEIYFNSNSTDTQVKYVHEKLEFLSINKCFQTKALSIFGCQVKLFREWFSGWSDDQKNYLVMRLQAIDGDFYSKYEKYVSDPEASKGLEKDYFEPGVPPEMVRKSSRSVLGPHSISPTPPAVGYSSNNFTGISSIESARPATIGERADSIENDEENCVTDELKIGSQHSTDSEEQIGSDSELKEINDYNCTNKDGIMDIEYQKQLTTITE